MTTIAIVPFDNLRFVFFFFYSLFLCIVEIQCNYNKTDYGVERSDIERINFSTAYMTLLVELHA